MNAVDTNVLVYSVDRRDQQKRTKARDVLRQLRLNQPPTILLRQVAGEFLRWLRWWQDQGQLNSTAVGGYVRLYRQHLTLTMPTLKCWTERLISQTVTLYLTGIACSSPRASRRTWTDCIRKTWAHPGQSKA